MTLENGKLNGLEGADDVAAAHESGSSVHDGSVAAPNTSDSGKLIEVTAVHESRMIREFIELALKSMHLTVESFVSPAATPAEKAAFLDEFAHQILRMASKTPTSVVDRGEHYTTLIRQELQKLVAQQQIGTDIRVSATQMLSVTQGPQSVPLAMPSRADKVA